MPFPAILTRLLASPDPDEALEDAQAATLDANLDRLRASDPDAARIIPAQAFTTARRERAVGDRLAQQLQDYAAVKHAQGRMDRYGELFAGLSN